MKAASRIVKNFEYSNIDIKISLAITFLLIYTNYNIYRKVQVAFYQFQGNTE